MDLTETKDIKKRWQEYTEELYKKDEGRQHLLSANYFRHCATYSFPHIYV